MEQEIIRHDKFHKHPLKRIPDVATQIDFPWNNWCSGCGRFFLAGEAAYGCSIKCGFCAVVHVECVAMPREIRHPLHHPSSHTLTLQFGERSHRCAVCEGSMYARLYYKCTSGAATFSFTWDARGGLVADEDEDEDEKRPPLDHPSHPQHQLGLSKKTSQGWCFLPCDACGTTEKGNSYICTVCDYWIHEACALLPPTARFPSHHHSLSLSFYPPYEYVNYQFDCAVCSEPLRLRCWVYHCHLCKYVVHLNCAPCTKQEYAPNLFIVLNLLNICLSYPVFYI